MIDAEIGELFPDSGATREHSRLVELPQIPGYEVEGVLGRGGMGVVYRARHLRLNRPVALKMLLSGPCAQPVERDRFRQEAEAVAGLNHPNIVPVYDSGEHDGRPFFTMELVEGGTLARKLAGTPLPARDAAALINVLADAVGTAHAAGIVHRDLKPSNVLLTPDGTPKVSDFGLARRVGGGPGLTQSGAAVGTPSYMSPCQARGDKHAVGPATDIYALGAILYECLTGRPPFKAESALVTLHQVLTQDPVPPSRLNARVPRDLETICLKCLEKDPARRYATAAALADDLGRYLRGDPIVARPPGTVERAARWVRRRPALAGALAAGVLLATGLIATVVWWNGQRAALAAAAVAYAEADLNESERLRDQGEFKASAAVLQRAKERLGEYVPPEILDRLSTAVEDLELVTRLEQIRLHQLPPDEGHSYSVATDQEYEAAFRDARLADGQANPDEVVARIRASSVHRSIVAALDDWASRTQIPARQAWCLEVARRADTNADSWHARVRDPKAWQDKAALAELAASVPVKGQSPSLLVALGRVLEYRGGDAIPLYRRVLAEYPDDLWANMYLGNLLLKRDPKEAIGHFRAALAVRPKSVVLANNLAVGLRAAGRLDEAIACYQRALHLDPGYAPAPNNLGLVLRDKGELDEAQASFERAVAADPTFVHAHMNLGNLLRRKKEAVKAIACYQEAARLSPGNAAPHGDRIMPEIDPKLAEYAARMLAGRQGVELRTRTPVRAIEPGCVRLPGETVAADTIVLAAGTVPDPVVAGLPLDRDGRGRVVVDATMRSNSRPEVWALGDCAAIPGPDGQPYPGLAQHALRAARVLAGNIAAVLDGRPPRPFVYRTLGMMAPWAAARGSASSWGCGYAGSRRGSCVASTTCCRCPGGAGSYGS